MRKVLSSALAATSIVLLASAANAQSFGGMHRYGGFHNSGGAFGQPHNPAMGGWRQPAGPVRIWNHPKTGPVQIPNVNRPSGGAGGNRPTTGLPQVPASGGTRIGNTTRPQQVSNWQGAGRPWGFWNGQPRQNSGQFGRVGSNTAPAVLPYPTRPTYPAATQQQPFYQQPVQNTGSSGGGGFDLSQLGQTVQTIGSIVGTVAGIAAMF